jgi:hypothetical protein
MKSTTAVALSGLTKNTVASYYDMFRNLIFVSMDVEECQIGGEEIIVNIDETKMGNGNITEDTESREYGWLEELRGHRSDGFSLLRWRTGMRRRCVKC